MAKLGRKDESQKSKHGGNYSGHHNKDDQPKSPRGGGSSQAAGKDPHRGDHGRHR